MEKIRYKLDIGEKNTKRDPKLGFFGTEMA